MKKLFFPQDAQFFFGAGFFILETLTPVQDLQKKTRKKAQGKKMEETKTQEPKTSLSSVAERIRNKEKIIVLTGCTNNELPDELWEKGQMDPCSKEIIEWIISQPINPRVGAVSKFLNELLENDKLLRCFSMNTDLQESLEAPYLQLTRGTFRSVICSKCLKKQVFSRVRKEWETDGESKCKKCEGLIRPCIAFGNENWMSMQQASEDLQQADLVLVLGFRNRLPHHTFHYLLDAVPKTTEIVFVDTQEQDLDDYYKQRIANCVERQDALTKEIKSVQEKLQRLNALSAGVTHVKEQIEARTQQPKLTISANVNVFANVMLRWKEVVE